MSHLKHYTAFTRLVRRRAKEQKRDEQINNCVKYDVRPFSCFGIKLTLLLLHGNIELAHCRGFLP